MFALPVEENVSALAATFAPHDLPRLIIYFQTTHDSNGYPISMLPLVEEKGIALTHLIVCSIHMNVNSVVHLNDYPPYDSRFYTLWNETRVLKNAGVKVMGMIGGAAPGSFDAQTLDAPDNATFERYYRQLYHVIRDFGLQGMDLDVEETMSDAGIARLVSRLSRDFGPHFLITLAPVATALEDSANLSGFNYWSLEQNFHDHISWYNAQFYNGFGWMGRTDDFERIVGNGFSPDRIVAGQITDGSFLPFDLLNGTVQALRAEYGQIGGIMGWEYFNSEPGGTAEPWQWAQIMTKILRPNARINLGMTKAMATQLEATWIASVIGNRSRKVKPTVDYMSMVHE